LNDQVVEEAIYLDAQYEKKFPGFTTDAGGVHMHMPAAGVTMRRFPP